MFLNMVESGPILPVLKNALKHSTLISFYMISGIYVITMDKNFNMFACTEKRTENPLFKIKIYISKNKLITYKVWIKKTTTTKKNPVMQYVN